jgi:hypothetical protein
MTPEIDVKALQLAARFSLPPNSLGYCGKDTAPAKLINCVTTGETADIEMELSKFIVLNPYLETISKIIEQPKFSYPVIEAYWLGNNELLKTKPEHYQLLLDNFTKQGVPSWLIDQLKIKVPKRFIPTHLFQVIHVGVGNASGSVPYNMETINQCMIRWGKVTEISGNTVAVTLTSLVKETGLYRLAFIDEKLTYNPEFLPNLNVKDIIAVHWKQAIKVLTPQEEEKLSFWTKEVLISLS